jgi:hypothetical protein
LYGIGCSDEMREKKNTQKSKKGMEWDANFGDGLLHCPTDSPRRNDHHTFQQRLNEMQK